MFNQYGLHNNGFYDFLMKANLSKLTTVSLSGTDYEIELMINVLDDYDIGGIELNFTCPNVCDHRNKNIPKSKHPIYLKLNCYSDPYQYDLDKIRGIRVNAVPCIIGGASGRYAKKKNFDFIRKFIKEGLSITGASFVEYSEIIELVDMGCTEIGIGCVIIVNPFLILKIKNMLDNDYHI